MQLSELLGLDVLDDDRATSRHRRRRPAHRGRRPRRQPRCPNVVRPGGQPADPVLLPGLRTVRRPPTRRAGRAAALAPPRHVPGPVGRRRPSRREVGITSGRVSALLIDPARRRLTTFSRNIDGDLLGRIPISCWAQRSAPRSAGPSTRAAIAVQCDEDGGNPGDERGHTDRATDNSPSFQLRLGEPRHDEDMPLRSSRTHSDNNGCRSFGTKTDSRTRGMWGIPVRVPPQRSAGQ